jgi:hypothetical protein
LVVAGVHALKIGQDKIPGSDCFHFWNILSGFDRIFIKCTAYAFDLNLLPSYGYVNK